MDKNWQKWAKTDENGQKRAKSVKICKPINKKPYKKNKNIYNKRS